ncbi:hypothetical protein WJX72_009126 [[Myrmecia] bisecta]|uniref:DUF1995 domain-containing protein n=1 Tax=[Myrmecia] bisecta TaxID=41462 RepID=A0AAW1PAQ5_9CHLO
MWTFPSDFKGSNACSGGVQVQQQAMSEAVEVPTHLNNIPHSRETRRFFYKEVCQAVQRAVAAGELRMKVRVTIPELNPQMDVYRVGTLLEMVRDVATTLAQDGKRVKVCVQQAMGQGVFQGLPLSLSGVRRIMDQMDWGSVGEFVSFGQVGADQVDEAAFYVLICPQNVVGNTILTNLGEMVDAAGEQGKHVILVNPQLTDVPSAGGVMGVRGRKERMQFAETFTVAYHYRLLYMSSAMMYPIMGCMRYMYEDQWQVYKRKDLGKRREEWSLAACFDSEPHSGQITALYKSRA